MPFAVPCEAAHLVTDSYFYFKEGDGENVYRNYLFDFLFNARIAL